MDQLMILLQRAMGVVDRFRTMEQRIPGGAVLVFGILAAFGLLNCLLGYRLMRFWMMLFGFLAGAGCSFAVAWYMGIPTQERRTYLIAMLTAGAVTALITFLFYRAGIFLMAAFLGVVLSIYLIHPTSSATFFACLLIGVLLGTGSFKYDREVIVLMTGLFGGTLAGYSLARIFHLEEMPYGILLCIGLSAAGISIQFATNRRTPSAEESEPEEYLEETNLQDMEEAEDPEELERRNRIENEAFYEQYFQGADVFDRAAEEKNRQESISRTAERKRTEAELRAKQKRKMNPEPETGSKAKTIAYRGPEAGSKHKTDPDQGEEMDIHLLAWNDKKRRGKP